jgi:prophage antirepressor-like protein
MNNLVPFKFESNEIRTFVDNDSIWVVAKDVMTALEYGDVSNLNKSLGHVPVEWKGRYRIPTPGGDQQLWCLSEQGLYFFVARSDKSKALPFQKWLAGEVVPTIRKTGGYQKPNLVESRQQACSVIKVELEVAKIFNVPEHIAQIEAVKHANILTGVDYGHLLAHAPAQNQIVYEEEMLEPKDLGERFGISAQKINKILAQEGYQLKGKASWIPTSLGEKFCTKHAWRKGFKSGYNLKWRVSLLDRLLQVVDTEEAA